MVNKTFIDKNSLAIKEDSKREQEFTFKVYNQSLQQFDNITVKSHFLDDGDHFGISILHDTWNEYRLGCIAYGVFDSVGNTFDDFSIYIDGHDEYMAMVEEFVLNTLFGDTGLITKYTYEFDEYGLIE